jgi:hypothetical protein
MTDDDAPRLGSPGAGRRAISALDKEAWLRVAEEWLKLASSVDARRR